MKRLPKWAVFCAAVCLMVLQSSCVVRSVHAWFTSSDVTQETDLLGGWVGTEGGKDVAMTFVRGDKNSYVVQYVEGTTYGTFRGTLGKIGGEYFLDFRPVEAPPGIEGLIFFPSHSVVKLEIGSEKLVVRRMNYNVAKARASGDKLANLSVSWDDENEMFITAKSEDLRSFLSSNSKDETLFSPAITLTRRK